MVCMNFKFYLSTTVSSWGTKLQTTAHVSEWIPMRSQENNLSYHVWNHNLNDLPVRVDVQVKPQTGTDTDYVFPGIAAAQRDDSMALPYGGIVYKYNKDSVMLFAPNKHLGKPSGHAIYTGKKTNEYQNIDIFFCFLIRNIK